jgi:hypothetical protein
MSAQTILTGFADLMQAARDLTAAQQAAQNRSRLYRVMVLTPRQAADVEMCKTISAWLCGYWSNVQKRPERR